VIVCNGGYGNLQGSYSSRDSAERLDGQAALIREMRVSWFAATELHEENGAYKSLLERTSWLQIALGDGGNHLLFDPLKYSVTGSRSWTLPYDRSASVFRLLHTATGQAFTIGVTHLLAGGTKGSQRAAQTKAWLHEIAKETGLVILCADLNSYSRRSSFPQGLLTKAGYRELRDRSASPITNARWDSHNDGGKPHVRAGRGHWIEGMFTPAAVRVNSGKLWPTNGLSDHNWLSAQFQIPDPTT